MNIEVRRFETNYIIDVIGEIDLYNAPRLKGTVQALLERGAFILILNMEKVTYIDSSGIGTLLAINARVVQESLRFCIVRIPPSVMRILELTRLTGVLPAMDTETEALEAFSKARSHAAQKTETPREDESGSASSAETPAAGDGKDIWGRIRLAIEQSKTFTVTTFRYLPHERRHIDRILATFLKAVDLSSMADDLSYCVHELAANAKKANAKRLYFAEQKLEMADESDYATGMKGFKQAVMDNIEHYHEHLRENGLYVKFQFRKVSDGLLVCVRNNVIPTPSEMARIDKKLAIAKRFDTFAEAYTQTEDDTEGAGLGIVMMLFMLRKLGIDQDCFGIRTEENETLATLTLRGLNQPLMEGTPFDGRSEEMIS